MKFISHRGNIEGRKEKEENSPEKILFCLYNLYEVEIDVWYINNVFFLGHDEPIYEIDDNFLKDSRLWCHAKNIESLKKMLELNINCFWHQEDDYTLTSKNYIWVYPGKPLIDGAIAVMPENTEYKLSELEKCHGICSDNIKLYKQLLKGV